MDATASGATGIAGRDTVSNCLRANDTALTASSHGFGGEHTPPLESPSEDVRGRRSRVVLTPGVCASSPAVMMRVRPDAHISYPQGDGGNSASLPEESTKDTVKTIRAGKAGRPASPVVHPCAFLSRTDLGCRRRPAFPAPLSISRASETQNSGESRREKAMVCLLFEMCIGERWPLRLLRHCERSEAIQAVSAERFWIASLRSQ